MRNLIILSSKLNNIYIIYAYMKRKQKSCVLALASVAYFLTERNLSSLGSRLTAIVQIT